jgi:hypothetical protein
MMMLVTLILTSLLSVSSTCRALGHQAMQEVPAKAAAPTTLRGHLQGEVQKQQPGMVLLGPLVGRAVDKRVMEEQGREEQVRVPG